MSVGDIHMSSGAPVPYAPQDEFTGGGDEDVNGTNEYPSPSSTVSPGPNQRNELGHSMNASTQSLPISGSSELAHALRTDHEPVRVEFGEGRFFFYSLSPFPLPRMFRMERIRDCQTRLSTLLQRLTACSTTTLTRPKPI